MFYQIMGGVLFILLFVVNGLNPLVNKLSLILLLGTTCIGTLVAINMAIRVYSKRDDGAIVALAGIVGLLFLANAILCGIVLF